MLLILNIFSQNPLYVFKLYLLNPLYEFWFRHNSIKVNLIATKILGQIYSTFYSLKLWYYFPFCLLQIHFLDLFWIIVDKILSKFIWVNLPSILNLKSNAKKPCFSIWQKYRVKFINIVFANNFVNQAATITDPWNVLLIVLSFEIPKYSLQQQEDHIIIVMPVACWPIHAKHELVHWRLNYHRCSIEIRYLIYIS